MANYRKHVYYTQFRKAVNVLDNAINQYNFDHGCGNKLNDSDEDILYDNLCWSSDNSASVADKLGKYINIAQWITKDNYEEVCSGYKKLIPTENYDGTEHGDYDLDELSCSNYLEHSYKNGYGFITTDGMLFNFALDRAYCENGIVDINGPNKGPNAYGRDMFVFYIRYNSDNIDPVRHRWGIPHEENCFENNKNGDNCGIRLLQEGKMNY